jgi:hypothetical protein
VKKSKSVVEFIGILKKSGRSELIAQRAPDRCRWLSQGHEIPLY